MSAILDSPEVRDARKSTVEASRALTRFLELKERLAEEANALIEAELIVARHWKQVREIADRENRAGTIVDYMGIGDALHPMVKVAYEGMKKADESVDEVRSICELPDDADFKIALHEMKGVDEYFGVWPRSDSARAEAVREEFARGEYRTFEEFVDEVSPVPLSTE